MKFQIALLISSRLFDFKESTYLLEMYLAMKLKESLMFLKSNAMCSMDLWREIGWKLPFQSSGFIGVLGSYGSWMLMTMSSLMYVAWSCVRLEGSCLSRTH